MWGVHGRAEREDSIDKLEMALLSVYQEREMEGRDVQKKRTRQGAEKVHGH